VRCARAAHLVVAVTEVQSRNIHASIDHADELFNTPTSRTDGADNLCPSLRGVRGGDDFVEPADGMEEWGKGRNLELRPPCSSVVEELT
jgi:hypothetical protein